MESKMKRLIFCLVIVTVWLIHFTSSPSLSATDRRIALVIGNGAYKSAPLRNPVNDATDMADALERLGFSVSLKTDANQRNMKQAIRAFGKQLRKGGVGLFYFAGHGVQVKGSNYLIPIGAQIESESDVEYEAVDAGRVLGKMEDAGNNLNIIILDACRDNPFGRSFRTGNRGLAKMDAPTGSILAYATAPGSVASDGPGRNGLYTSALLKHMVTPKLKIEDIFKKVRIDVIKNTELKQVPWESSSLTGDFYFNPERALSVVKIPKTEQPLSISATLKDELESLAEKIRKKRAAKIRKFMQLKDDTEKFVEIKKASSDDQQTINIAWNILKNKYPHWTSNVLSGDTRGVIKKAINNDKEGVLYELEISEKEREKWKSAKSVSSEESFRGYLLSYPNGFHADEAKRELENLIEEKNRIEAEGRLAAIKVQEEEREKKAKITSMRRTTLAGLWRIKSTYSGHPNMRAHNFYYDQIIEIHQKGKFFSFTLKNLHKLKHLVRGTYEEGQIKSFKLTTWAALDGTNTSEKNVQLSGDKGKIAWRSFHRDLLARGESYHVLTRMNIDTNYSNIITNISKAGLSSCFIATAAYGSPWESNVLILRKFRERWLNTNGAGRFFVRIYYNLSPPVADFIAKKEWFRMVTRGLLTPIVIIVGTLIGNVLYIFIVVISSLIFCASFYFLLKRKSP